MPPPVIQILIVDASAMARTHLAKLFALYGRYQVTFPSARNRYYRVETSGDLVNWQVLVPGLIGTGTDVTVTDIRNPFTTTPAFYRVVVY